MVSEFSRCVTEVFHLDTVIDAVGRTPTRHESGGGCPTCPQGNVLLKQVGPGRSTKKPQVGRGRARDGSASNSPHLSHLQP